MIPGLQALEKLREGNRRFVAGEQSEKSKVDPMQRSDLLNLQEPHSIILGCSDARVPAELVFDQGLGDLFVIRVAGNIVAPSQVGSVEFAAEQHGIQLVVVMGHSHCAAIGATLDELDQPTENRSPNLKSIVDRIRPHVITLHETELKHDREMLHKSAIRANVRACVSHLQHGSHILEQLIAARKLLIVGAVYSLETGAVEFFEDVPAGGESIKNTD